ncbi:MAG: hypothetical protein ACE37K_11215 [Planctomycetota bacterium]
MTEERVPPFLANVPEIDLQQMPVKAGQTIYAGACLELNGGYLEVASGAGTFAGFALETSLAVSGEADGDRTIGVRAQGGIELDITTETALQSDVGAAAVTVEATDDNTFRIERASAITGLTVGKIVTVLSGSRVAVLFKGAMVP